MYQGLLTGPNGGREMEIVTRYRNTDIWLFVTTCTLYILLTFYQATQMAATMYKWVDEDGNVTYQDYPPPTNSRILSESDLDELNLTMGTTNDVASEDNPVTLYTTPNCEVCDLVRMNLTKLRLPFTERKLNSDRAAQQELQDKTGQLVAQTLFIGETRIMAFSQEQLRGSALDAGYEVPELPQDQPENGETDPLLGATDEES